MISKSEYKILKTLKNEPKPRDSFKDTKTVDALINNGYIEITHGDKIKDTEELPLDRNHKLVVPATFEQMLKLTSKGIDAIAEYKKHLIKRLFSFLRAPFNFIVGTIFDHGIPKFIEIFKSKRDD